MPLQTRLTPNPLKEDYCVRGYTLSLVLATQLDPVLLDCYQRGALSLWGGAPTAPMQPCHGVKHSNQKRLLSIHFVQSRNCDSLLKRVYLYISSIWWHCICITWQRVPAKEHNRPVLVEKWIDLPCICTSTNFNSTVPLSTLGSKLKVSMT